MSAQHLLSFTAVFVMTASVNAQPPQGGRGGAMPEAMREAQQLSREGKFDEALAIYAKENANNQAGTLLDLMGKSAEARKYFQRVIDTASDAAARANAHRAMAMSYAFEGDCR